MSQKLTTSVANQFPAKVSDVNERVRVDKVREMLQNAFRLDRIVRNARETKRGGFPEIVIPNFRRRNLKVSPCVVKNAAQYPPLVLQRLAAAKVEVDF